MSKIFPKKLVNKIFVPFEYRKNELSIEYGCILSDFRVVIPIKLRTKVLTELHSSHFGIVKIKTMARSYIWVPIMHRGIEN
uniref:RNA-directed DNA polymerase n=1 Tax=Glossina morsitans morsitans TaxID=37546 RepID=A0A1B0FM97_GLOMM